MFCGKIHVFVLCGFFDSFLLLIRVFLKSEVSYGLVGYLALLSIARDDYLNLICIVQMID